MRIGAFLGTKDDADIMPAAIEHLRRIGVSTIVVLDYGSTDASVEYLAEAEARGDIWVLHLTADDPYDTWGQIIVKVSRSLGVDWVLFSDADELWLPASGSLLDLRDLDEVDVLTVRRYNVAIGPDGPSMPLELPVSAYEDVILWAKPVAGIHQTRDDDDGPPWISGLLEPKVLVRPEVIGKVRDGDHGIDCRDGRCRRAIARDVVVAHVPFRSLEQFERKAVNYQQAIAAHPEWYADLQGWQWVRWARQYADGRLAEEYARQVTGEAEFERLRADATLRSVAEMHERLIPAFDTEEDYAAAVDGPEPWLSAAGVVCRRAGLDADMGLRAVPGGQHPVVTADGYVVKLYGRWREGPTIRRSELFALRALGTVPDLPVPHLIAAGALDEDWEYLAETRLTGQPVIEVRDSLGVDGIGRIAAWLGTFVRRLHDVPLDPARAAVAAREFDSIIADRRARAVSIWAEEDRLPRHLLDQLDAWLPTAAELRVPERGGVLLHGDLHDEQVLGRWTETAGFEPTGVIDFNRARVGHPLYELGPIWRWFLRGEPRSMRTFLDAAVLPGSDRPDFPRLALAWCLLHGGVAQYRLDLPGIGTVETLDELAERAFGRTPAPVAAGDGHTG